MSILRQDEIVLVINAGSSSLKFGLYARHESDVRPEWDGAIDGIGLAIGTVELKDARGQRVHHEVVTIASQTDALHHALESLRDKGVPSAVGHRVVHGGPRLVAHQRITPEMLETLRAHASFAPLHVPVALALIEAAQRAYPEVPHIACFDTAFHATLPPVAARLPLPASWFERGVRRYGFHGLSYESIVHRLGKALPARTVIAHLGSGASLVALRDGISVDTSMGMTPTGGIPMATRTGDLDPGVLVYLLREGHLDADALEQLCNHDGGLGALSGGEHDMRALEKAAARGDANAQLAIDAFCAAVAKFVAGYATVLGGLDLLVFSGGIGEHSESVRSNVCGKLAFMRGLPFRVVASEEDRQIARHCLTLLPGR